jgi:uncharacterized protein (TIGR00297 family)
MIGGALAALVAGLSYWLRLLSFSGAVAALVVGFLIFGFGGIGFAGPLLAFFLSSSLLSQVGRKRKESINALYAKGSTRDAMQVFANGGVAALLAAVFPFLEAHRETALMMAIASLAAVNADTWATEIGSLQRGSPWMVTTLRRVPAGTSGAVSWLGLLAALLGSLFIGLVGVLTWPPRSIHILWQPEVPELLAVVWAGFLAALADSILGGGLQAQYRCLRCGALTERKTHCPNAPVRLGRGFRWMTNDLVNLIASLLGALFVWFLLAFFVYPA